MKRTVKLCCNSHSGRSMAGLAVGDWASARAAATAQCTDETALNASLIPTRHFQRSLPRLPVPLLGSFLRRYATALKPLVTPAAFDETVRAMKEFEAKEGGRLQDELVSTDRANQHTSFISSDWFEKVLKERDPLPLRRSCTLLVRSPAASHPAMNMLGRATLWIRSSILYYKAYLDNTLYPDVRYVPDDVRAYYQQDWFERTIALCPEYVSSTFMSITSGGHALPVDMSQYDNLFNSTRAPGVLQDEVRAVGFMPHIVVQHRGRQFAVTVADADCNPLPEDQIYARLRAVVTSPAASSRPRVDVGVFTTLPRTEWNGARTALLRHAKNQKSLEMIDSCMFLLNLDDEGDQSLAASGTDFFLKDPKAAMTAAAAKMGNRWWDKSVAVNVSQHGGLSVTYEESWGDGAAVRRYIEDVFQHSMRRLASGTGVIESSKSTEAVRELQWTLTPELEQVAAKAERSALQRMAQLDVSVGVVEGFFGAHGGSRSDTSSSSSSTCASSPTRALPASVSGDAVVQLAAQLAWWRLNTSAVCSVQPVPMHVFRRGRMDCLYTATEQSQAFAVALTSGRQCSPDARALCLAALEAYETQSKEVAAGAGLYAHLLALRNVSQRLYGRVPSLTKDPSYALLTNPQLVVAPEGAPSLLAATANPTASGYGVSYTTISDLSEKTAKASDCGGNGGKSSIIVNVSAWKGAEGPRHSASDFSDALLQAVSDIHGLLATTSTS